MCGQWVDVSCLPESSYCCCVFVHLFVHFSFRIFKIKFFRHTFLVNCEDYEVETWYTQGQWVDVSCITQLGSYCLFLPLFLQFSFQFSNIKMFRHTFIRNYEAYKLKTWYRHGQSCILESFCYFVFVPLFIFVSCQFSNIKIFITFFLMICLAYNVETWHTHGQWVDVSCILESGCYFLSVPLFLIFSFQFPNIKNLYACMCRVYRNQAATLYLSLYFFIFRSLQVSNIKHFLMICLAYNNYRKRLSDTWWLLSMRLRTRLGHGQYLYLW